MKTYANYKCRMCGATEKFDINPHAGVPYAREMFFDMVHNIIADDKTTRGCRLNIPMRKTHECSSKRVGVMDFIGLSNE